MAGLAAYTILQTEHLQRIKSIILWESLTIHGSVNLLVVHQNQNAILVFFKSNSTISTPMSIQFWNA